MLNFVFILLKTTYVGDLTPDKNEAFFVYHTDVSQKSTRQLGATVENYKKTDVDNFVKLCGRKKRRRVHFCAKNQLDAGKLRKVTYWGKTVFATSKCEEDYQKAKRRQKILLCMKGTTKRILSRPIWKSLILLENCGSSV